MGLAQPLTDKAAPAAKTATAPSPTIVADKGGVELTAEETNSVITAILEPQAQPGDSAAKVQEPSLISRIASATKNLVRRAASWLGARYAWGGTSRKGVDCSGLTKILYADEGIGLPHSARQQFKLGQKVAKNDMAPGDLVFFNTRGPISHVGIYIGNNQFVHAANRRRGVRVDSLGSAYYSKRFAGARRYKDVG